MNIYVCEKRGPRVPSKTTSSWSSWASWVSWLSWHRTFGLFFNILENFFHSSTPSKTFFSGFHQIRARLTGLLKTCFQKNQKSNLGSDWSPSQDINHCDLDSLNNLSPAQTSWGNFLLFFIVRFLCKKGALLIVTTVPPRTLTVDGVGSDLYIGCDVHKAVQILGSYHALNVAKVGVARVRTLQHAPR